jgi:hypothetical protein
MNTIDKDLFPTPEQITPQVRNLQKYALIAAVVGLVLCGIGAVMNSDTFFQSYLIAYMFWLGISVGALGILMLHFCVGGGWGFIIRRFLEAAVKLFPLLIILGIPLVFGAHALFVWMDPATLSDPLIAAKAAYLNTPFFWIRVVIYFAVFMGFAHFGCKWSAEQDERCNPMTYHRLNLLGPAGIVFITLCVTFMGYDWVLSLTPHYYSSVFGLIICATDVVTMLAIMFVLVHGLAGHIPLLERIPDNYVRDLGNVMLASTLAWAWFAFSQYIITYSGNISHEALWYTMRRGGGWQLMGAVVCILHFGLPFLLLQSSALKTRTANLAKFGYFVLAMRFLNWVWLIRPAFDARVVFYIADLGAMLFIGGLWLWFFGQKVLKRPLVPLYDPRFMKYWIIAEHTMHEHELYARKPVHAGEDAPISQR